jgi:4-alpha-glucanotransferase
VIRHRLSERASGILLHPTSLPGPHGCGDAGPAAERFARWLQSAGQSWWQMLPVVPAGVGNSPYSSPSAMAGNPLLISPERLVATGLLTDAELRSAGTVDAPRVDPAGRWDHRERLLRAAFARFASRKVPDDFDEFCASHATWLEDWALYAALKRRHGETGWTRWPDAVRARRKRALDAARRELVQEIAFHRFLQWVFDVQWRDLRRTCAELGIALLGDLPIFVAHDSADVWAHQDLFELDAQGKPTVVAGVPPDYFSRTGQRWGNPLYRWDVLKKRGYSWWIARLRQMLDRFDAIRLDHFIGFVHAWAVPAAEETAANGQYVPGPGAHFFEKVREALGELPLVAEDLGAVTPEVTALRDRFELPGMRVLQFAFGSDPQAATFRPHAYPPRSVAYTGTHDNDTARGWFDDPSGSGSEMPQNTGERRRALLYLGARDGSRLPWDFIRGVYASAANLAIAPLQDVLNLGSEARMNRPGVAEGNWGWRVPETALTAELAAALAELAALFDRAQPAPGLEAERRTTQDERRAPA